MTICEQPLLDEDNGLHQRATIFAAGCLVGIGMQEHGFICRPSAED
jgi:hypothetical protein